MTNCGGVGENVTTEKNMSEFQYTSQEADNISDTEHVISSHDDHWEYAVTDMVWSIYSPILLCVGIVGNTLSFVALRGHVLKTRVSSIFLRALSVADTMALIFGLLPIWPIHMAGYDVTSKHDVICKLRNFLFYTFSDNSVWLICAFTFDRLIAVAFPFRKKVLCTKRNAYIAIAVVCCLSTIKNVEILVTRRLMEMNQTLHVVSRCGTPDSHHNYYNTYVRPWVVFTFVSAIPCVFIIACNVFIIRSLYKMKKLQAACMPSLGVKRSPGLQVASMTRMCLTVSCTFLLLISPSLILLIGRPYWTRTAASEARYYLARGVANLCQYTNNAINFLLYCGAGQAFRRELITLMTCHCDKEETCVASQDATTYTNHVIKGHRQNTLVTQARINHLDESNRHTKPCHV